MKNQIYKNHQIYKDRREADVKIGLKETVTGDIEWTEEFRLQHDVKFCGDGHELLDLTTTGNLLNGCYNLQHSVVHKINYL